MALRFQLLNEVAGPLIIEKADPIGINSLNQTIKRSDDNEGVIYEIVIDIDFIKEGRRYLKYCFEEAGGVDAEVIVNIYDLDPNNRRWELYFTGRVNMNKYELFEDRLSVAIEQTGFERRVLNLLETDVDLDALASENGTALPVTPTVNMEYHSKAILKEYYAQPIDSNEFSQPDAIIHHFGGCEIGPCDRPRDATVFGQFDTSDVKLKELVDTFSYPFGTSPENYFENYRASEAGIAKINFQFRFKMSIFVTQTGSNNDIDACGSSSGILGRRRVFLYFEHRDVNNNVKTLTNIGEYTGMGAFCGGGDEIIGDFQQFNHLLENVTIDIGDKIYFYYTLRIYGNYELSGGSSASDLHHEIRITADKPNCFIQIQVKTTAPSSTAKTFLLYEAVQKCCQYYTNQADCFRSDLLGRSDIVAPDGSTPYLVDGDASMIGLVNGNNLRGRPKQTFANLQDLLEFINSAFCTGFGFEMINGKQVLRLERREFFYRKDQRILSLGKVANIKKSLAVRKYQNQIEVGYAGKLDIGQTNAIDEFNTTRRFGVPIVNTKNTLKVSTKMRASGYQIEYQRRLVSSTEDGKLDDQNFVVSVIRDGMTFRTKRDEGYVSITNVYDVPSGYNYDLSPGRMVKNWFKVLAASLIRSQNKIVKFNFGEVNYTMTSQKVGEFAPTLENGNIDLTNVEPIWDNELYSFKCPLSREEMKLIKAAPYGYIEFEDLYGEVMEGFIQQVEHEPNEGMAEFQLLKVFRP